MYTVFQKSDGLSKVTSDGRAKIKNGNIVFQTFEILALPLGGVFEFLLHLWYLSHLFLK